MSCSTLEAWRPTFAPEANTRILSSCLDLHRVFATGNCLRAKALDTAGASRLYLGREKKTRAMSASYVDQQALFEGHCVAASNKKFIVRSSSSMRSNIALRTLFAELCSNYC